MDIYVVIICMELLCLSCVGTDETPEVGCEKCGCCEEIANTTTCGFNSTVKYQDFCFNGCKNGFWGYRCYNKCEKNCVACARNLEKNEKTPACTECPDGKYLGSDRTCTLSCRKQCSKCSTNDFCSECKTPYFNTDTITNCSAFCPTNCICDRYDHCSRCKTGFYNVSESCSSACSDNCENCVSATHCNVCIRGRYGNTCEFNCSSSCVNDTCSIDDGSCICKPFTFYDSFCLDDRTIINRTATAATTTATTGKPRLLELLAIIQGGSIFLSSVVFIITVVLLISMKRRRNKRHEEDQVQISLSMTNNMYENVTISNNNNPQENDELHTYQNTAIAV